MRGAMPQASLVPLTPNGPGGAALPVGGGSSRPRRSRQARGRLRGCPRRGMARRLSGRRAGHRRHLRCRRLDSEVWVGVEADRRVARVIVELGSFTNDVPFHTTTSLAAVMFGELKLTVTGLRNVPELRSAVQVTCDPRACHDGEAVLRRDHGKVRRGDRDLHGRSGRLPGDSNGDLAPSTVTGPTVPPPVPMVTGHDGGEPAGRQGSRTGGGPYRLPDAVAARAVPPVAQAVADPMR